MKTCVAGDSDATVGCFTCSDQSRVLVGYNIYRTNVYDIPYPDDWERVATNIPDRSYVDSGWATAATGAYRYLVQAVYSQNNLSLPAFSNMVAKNMYATVTLRLEPSDGGSTVGAIVRLRNVNEDPAYSHNAIATGNIVTIPNVWLGRYTLVVDAPGYGRYSNENMNITVNDFNHVVPLFPSNMLLEEGFDGDTFPPFGWTRIDNDGDGHHWQRTNQRPHSGGFAAFSESWSNALNDALTPDNWLITPRIHLPSVADNINLRFFISAQDPSYPFEVYSVMVSTEENINIPDFERVHTRTLDENQINWFEENVDLLEFKGQSVYIAFRHETPASAQFVIMLDTITLTYQNLTEDADVEIVPRVTSLGSNFPNPFNPSTEIAFDLATEGNVRIDVFNVRGQRVRTLTNDHFSAGSHRITWVGTDDNDRQLSSGIYFYRMETMNYTSTRKMMLLK